MKQPPFTNSYDAIQHVTSGSFPVVIAFSGGKDSIAMVLLMLELGVSRSRIHLHHHDVDGNGKRVWDWQCTESYCKAFAEAFGLKLFFSGRVGGITREIFRNNEPRQNVYYQVEPETEFYEIPSNPKRTNTRMKFPAVSGDLRTRWCSATAKIEVMASTVCHHPAYQQELVILTGERREESTKRERYNDVEVYRSSTITRKALLIRPILDWSEEQVWDIIKRWGIQPHPCYMLGWNRCSCQLCIFGGPRLWATNALYFPEKVKEIADIEQQIGFTLYSGTTSIYDKVAAGQPMTLNQYWLEQATGAFTAPITVDNWELPAGAFKKEISGPS